MPDAWAFRNCRHVGDARRGAGPRPAAARIRRIVLWMPKTYARPAGADTQAGHGGEEAAVDSRCPRPNRAACAEDRARAGLRGGFPAVQLRVPPEALGA